MSKGLPICQNGAKKGAFYRDIFVFKYACISRPFFLDAPSADAIINNIRI